MPAKEPEDAGLVSFSLSAYDKEKNNKDVRSDDNEGVVLSPLGTVPEEVAFSNVEDNDLIEDEDTDVQLTPLETNVAFAPPDVYATPTGAQGDQGMIDSDAEVEQESDPDYDFHTDDDWDEYLHEDFYDYNDEVAMLSPPWSHKSDEASSAM